MAATLRGKRKRTYPRNNGRTKSDNTPLQEGTGCLMSRIVSPILFSECTLIVGDTANATSERADEKCYLFVGTAGVVARRVFILTLQQCAIVGRKRLRRDCRPLDRGSGVIFRLKSDRVRAPEGRTVTNSRPLRSRPPATRGAALGHCGESASSVARSVDVAPTSVHVVHSQQRNPIK